jgi:hypothetical protein
MTATQELAKEIYIRLVANGSVNLFFPGDEEKAKTYARTAFKLAEIFEPENEKHRF